MANSTKLKWPTTSTTIGTSAYNPPSHNGIDIIGSLGDPIYSVADGEVTHIVNDLNGSMGYYVFIKHGTKTVSLDGTKFLRSQYLHLREQPTFISVGSSVSKGQVIGYMGNTGNSRGVHLHLDFKENSTAFSSSSGYTTGTFTNPNSYVYG